MAKLNNLPFIRVDAVLSKLGGRDKNGVVVELKEGDKVKTSEVLKAMWAYIRTNDLKA